MIGVNSSFQISMYFSYFLTNTTAVVILYMHYHDSMKKPHAGYGGRGGFAITYYDFPPGFLILWVGSGAI